MSYTKEWTDAEELVKDVVLGHSHAHYHVESDHHWAPSSWQILRAILAFAGLGLPGALQALRAERTAIYAQMAKSVTAYMEENGDDPAAILCGYRDFTLATAPYGMSTVGVGPDVPKDFYFQGTKVLTYKKLFSDSLEITAVGEDRAASRV